MTVSNEYYLQADVSFFNFYIVYYYYLEMV